ncbi:MAG: carboxypeptidase regulatory-like domain-containing protein [Anaerolineae bacterium]
MKIRLLLLLVFMVLVMNGCGNEEPVDVSQVTAIPTPLITMTATPIDTTIPPTNTATATATETITPAPTLAPTATPTLTPTPLPSLVVLISGSEDEANVPGASVSLVSEAGDFQVDVLTDEYGTVSFYNLPQTTLTVTVTAEGYLPWTTAVPIAPATTELQANLTAGSLALVMAETANLRSGPGKVYSVMGTAVLSETLAIISQSEDANWLVVQLDEETTGWIAADLVEIQGHLDYTIAMAAPPTPTLSPTRVVAAPPPAAPPAAGNLLPDPGFENRLPLFYSYIFANPWTIFYTLDDSPATIHSGATSFMTFGGSFYQQVSNVSPGVTYRFGAWVRMWCSDGLDRSISENPRPTTAYICINTNGDHDRWLPSSICSQPITPLDTWQYISVDAISTNDLNAAILYVTNDPGNPNNCEVYWDDLYFGASSVVPTATPASPGPPTRPEPTPFAGGAALRDNMNHVRSMFEQLGGILDRMANGESGDCAEYEDYFRQIVTSPTYHSVPGEWQGIYNEYIGSVELGISRTEQIYEFCQNGGGWLNPDIYGLTRSGINEVLDKLHPAINAANALLDG